MNLLSYLLLTNLLIINAQLLDINNNNDIIQTLPGINSQPKFKHYSGYLNASSDVHLFYWFVESESNPSHDPVILWLSGGPGCSSLSALLNEIGPWRVNGDGKTLSQNPFSWNKIANILFLESPAGVGFSYEQNTTHYINDTEVAMDNYMALQSFFKKFPQFASNEFYITGQSYAGVYIPFLAWEIIQQNKEAKNIKINLKGIAIGNGFLDDQLLQTSAVYYAFSHGIIDTKTWNEFQSLCCNCEMNEQKCNIKQKDNPKCKNFKNIVYPMMFGWNNETRDKMLNTYNIYKQCYHPINHENGLINSRHSIDMYLKAKSLGLTNYYHLWDENLNNNNDNDDVYSGILPCVDDSFSRYLNDPKVRDAIHVRKDYTSAWSTCSLGIILRYKQYELGMKSHIMNIINSLQLKSLIIYNGDYDMVCDFIGDQWFVDSLNLTLVNDYHQWKYDNKIAGSIKRFKGLTFIVVKGAGHMVAEDKPGAALKIIEEMIGKSKL